MSKRNKNQIIAALLACAICIVLAGSIQTDRGKVEMTDITIETKAGNLAAYLFKPQNATAESPAPAVVCLHGYLNNREMQDCNYVELARRGYVVIALDGFSHGNSDVPTTEKDSPEVKSNGMVAAVEYLDALDYVDSSKIGCTGHSMGGQYTITTMTYYSELEREALKKGMAPSEAHKLNKVNTGVIVGNYPTQMAQNADGETFLCHCSVIGAKYDEFFFENTAVILTSKNSENFVSNLLEKKADMPLEEGKTYVSPSTGYTITLYNPKQFHATNHFSVKCVKYLLESFERTMPAPKKIASSNQVWWLKEAANCIGLIGFFAFIVPFMELLLKTKLFKQICRKVRTYKEPDMKKYLKRNIGRGAVNSLLILPLMGIGYLLLVSPVWPQDTSGGIAVWSIGCALVILGAVKKDFGKKLKGNSKELGTDISAKELWLTLLLSLITAAAAYALLFAADAINQTDFRIWSFDIRTFPLKKVWVAIKYLPLFAPFYIAQSISVSRATCKGWSERKQILICGLMNMIAPALMLIVTYAPTPIFQATTWVALCSAIGMSGIAAVFALIPILLLPFVHYIGYFCKELPPERQRMDRSLREHTYNYHDNHCKYVLFVSVLRRTSCRQTAFAGQSLPESLFTVHVHNRSLDTT